MAAGDDIAVAIEQQRDDGGTAGLGRQMQRRDTARRRPGFDIGTGVQQCLHHLSAAALARQVQRRVRPDARDGVIQS